MIQNLQTVWLFWSILSQLYWFVVVFFCLNLEDRWRRDWYMGNWQQVGNKPRPPVDDSCLTHNLSTRSNRCHLSVNILLFFSWMSLWIRFHHSYWVYDLKMNPCSVFPVSCPQCLFLFLSLYSSVSSFLWREIYQRENGNINSEDIWWRWESGAQPCCIMH